MISQCTHPLHDGDSFSMTLKEVCGCLVLEMIFFYIFGGSDNLQPEIGEVDINVIGAPCHTRGHVMYHIQAPGMEGALFSGDTIFVGGVGMSKLQYIFM